MRKLSWFASEALLFMGLAAISAGPLAPAAVAATPPGAAMHSLGWNPTPGLPKGISATGAYLAETTALPASVDLSAWTPPVESQGDVGACTSWATGYYYRYWLRNHATGETSTFAPMYLYSQIAKGDVMAGSSFGQNFAIMESQGIDHEVDYPQGDYDYTTQPTPAEVTAAAPFKILSGTELLSGPNTYNQTAVEASIAAGRPVLLSIPVYPNFDGASAADPFVDVPSPGTTSRGDHAVFAPKYDASGVWIENSWGTDWGQEGWAELSWAFVRQYAKEGWYMTADNDTLAVTSVNSYVAGAAQSVTVTALKANGNTDSGYLGTIHFTSTDAKAVLPADYTFTVADTGVHQFLPGITFKTAASQTIRARDTVTATITGTQSSITVTPAAATTLTVSGFPSTRTAGSTHSVVVTALDAYGNTASGYLGTIHFTSTDLAAVLPANYTFTGADGGVHVFSVTLKTAGSQGVRARDTVTATITGAQYGIVVTPAAAKTLVVSGLASPRTAGVAGTVTVTAKDAYGNTATGYTGTVTFTSTDTKATLPANYKFTAANAGTHTFSVTLKTAGTQAIRARDTVTSTITGLQSGIIVTAAAATTLTVSGLASPRTHGTAGTITVTVRDAYGNIATGYRGTVTFTSTDSHALLPANYTFTAANAGTHTFSVTLKSVGTQAVRARDTVTATITGLQGGIVVT
jgi:C1A family cysteine protease